MIYRGSGVAIVTPFTSNMDVNYNKLDELIEEQIAAGTDAIIICGTTGEASTMTEVEHVETIRFTAERVRGRIPVVAGTGSNCTKTTIELSVAAQQGGADALLVVSPYYNKATQNGLIAHFSQVAEAVSCPIILYNIPGRTGVAITAETTAALVQRNANIIGMKDASGDLGHMARMMYLCDGKLDLYSGNDDQVLPLLSLGGQGVISVMANVLPTYMHDMIQKFFDGDIEGCRKMQFDILPLFAELFREVSPIPIKAAMNLMGKEVGGLRAPLTTLEPQHGKLLEHAMRDFKLL